MQFHTGLGDSDITLTLSSPAHLQPIIKQFPETLFVLLHSSYPYTRDAGYLAAVYPNVFLDFGEVRVGMLMKEVDDDDVRRFSHSYPGKANGRSSGKC